MFDVMCPWQTPDVAVKTSQMFYRLSPVSYTQQSTYKYRCQGARLVLLECLHGGEYALDTSRRLFQCGAHRRALAVDAGLYVERTTSAAIGSSAAGGDQTDVKKTQRCSFLDLANCLHKAAFQQRGRTYPFGGWTVRAVRANRCKQCCASMCTIKVASL